MYQRTEINPQEVPSARNIQDLRQQQKQNTFITLANDQLDAQTGRGHKYTSLSTCAPEDHLLRVTIPDAVLIQFDLLRMSKILLETCTCRGL